MRRAKVFVHGIEAGVLKEVVFSKHYVFEYNASYTGSPISLSMPTTTQVWDFDRFPPFFDGLLPEGFQLEGLLKNQKLDRNDYFSQLITVGNDLVGNITIKPV